MALTLTVPAVARRFNVPHWAVRNLFTRHLLPDPPRAGLTRLISVDDLPAIEQALRTAGYLPAIETRPAEPVCA